MTGRPLAAGPAAGAAARPDPEGRAGAGGPAVRGAPARRSGRKGANRGVWELLGGDAGLVPPAGVALASAGLWRLR